MEARNRTFPQWFERIRTRQIQLPRFQRYEAWSPDKIADLLSTVLRGLPAGSALVLEVGDSTPFVSRSMVTAPQEGDRVTELLLDGQQRLTALWRALNDGYEDRTYFVRGGVDWSSNELEAALVVGQPRWRKNGRLYPMWADTPSDVWQRGLIPLSLLRPVDITGEIDTWISAVAGNDHKLERELDRQIQALRARVREFNLPFLYLPPPTPKEVALDVFLKLNTSSVRLTTFDILVAQVEARTGQPLHDLVASLKAAVPAAASYKEPSELILDVAALLQDRSPSQAGYWRMDLDGMVRDWQRLTEGVRGMVGFLEGESVLDGDRLPTDAVLAVVAALWPMLPQAPDALGNAKILLRKFVWRAFLTDRYEQAAATAAFNDFRGLRGVLDGSALEADVPLFNEREYPPPEPDQLLGAGWPKNRGILGRGILALSLAAGAHDIADDAPIRRDNVREREYHHLFPAALLRSGGVPEHRAFRALNCALITWKTNRTIGAQEPVQYLQARSDASRLGEAELRRRLMSHLVRLEDLAHGGYAQMPESTRAQRILTDYESFLRNRAELIAKAAGMVWTGRRLQAGELK